MLWQKETKKVASPVPLRNVIAQRIASFSSVEIAV